MKDPRPCLYKPRRFENCLFVRYTCPPSECRRTRPVCNWVSNHGLRSNRRRRRHLSALGKMSANGSDGTSKHWINSILPAPETFYDKDAVQLKQGRAAYVASPAAIASYSLLLYGLSGGAFAALLAFYSHPSQYLTETVVQSSWSRPGFECAPLQNDLLRYELLVHRVFGKHRGAERDVFNLGKFGIGVPNGIRRSRLGHGIGVCIVHSNHSCARQVKPGAARKNRRARRSNR